MALTPPRFWHQGRTILLVSWLLASVSYLSLFFGATYTEEGFAPGRLLLGLLFTQAFFLIAALLSHYPALPSPVEWARRYPRRVFAISLAAQTAALIAVALTMRVWNDEEFNLEQAAYFAQHGLTKWLADYGSINFWLGLHHPPLLALLYALFYRVCGAHLLAGRLFNILFSAAALVAAHRLVRRTTEEPTAALASLAWPLFPVWLFNGAAAILEGPFLLVLLLTADAFVAFLEKPTHRRGLAAGGWLALGMLCRYNIVLLLPGLLLLLLGRDRRALWRNPATAWIAVVPLILLAPLAWTAAGSGLLATQKAQLSWVFLLLRPGGVAYMLGILLPLWPLQVGAHLIPAATLSLGMLWKGEGKNPLLLTLGGCYLLLVLVILPNPRYFLPAVPFLAVGAARLLQYLRAREKADTAVWLGLLAASLTLTVLVLTGAKWDGFYPFY
ncbi:MAG: glycosyltransferase family 39 protein [Myxococcales bacterium]|nr:glycosyltransferase family 39 protein [Myxococcales bacterium]